MIKVEEKGKGVPRCRYLLGGTRVCLIRANYGDEMVHNFLPNLGLLNATTNDILVANFAFWHHMSADTYGRLVKVRLTCILHASTLEGGLQACCQCKESSHRKSKLTAFAPHKTTPFPKYAHRKAYKACKGEHST